MSVQCPKRCAFREINDQVQFIGVVGATWSQSLKLPRRTMSSEQGSSDSSRRLGDLPPQFGAVQCSGSFKLGNTCALLNYAAKAYKQRSPTMATPCLGHGVGRTTMFQSSVYRRPSIDQKWQRLNLSTADRTDRDRGHEAMTLCLLYSLPQPPDFVNSRTQPATPTTSLYNPVVQRRKRETSTYPFKPSS